MSHLAEALGHQAARQGYLVEFIKTSDDGLLHSLCPEEKINL
jgi:hypothetical protein